MIANTQLKAVTLAVVLILSIVTIATGPVAAAADPSPSVSNAPDTVGPNDTFTIEYELENTGADVGSFSLAMPNLPSTVTVESIEGDIQSSDVAADPPSASTNAVAGGETISVAVTYNASNASIGDTTFELSANQPLDGTSGSTSATVTIEDAVATPNVTATGGADVVRQGSTYEQEFTISNAGTAPGAFTLTVSDVGASITINDITGDLQSTDVGATPPSATTDSVNASGSVTVSVNYTVASDAALGTTTPFTLAAEQPIDGTADSQSRSVMVKEPEPTDPQDRATEISGKSDPAELTQNDITAAITRFDRGQTVDGLNIGQNDITTLITLFDRNR